MRFTAYRQISEDPLTLEQVGEPLEGGAGFLDRPADLHLVENPEEFGEDVVTLHLYSKPYDACDVYYSMTGPKRRAQLVCDSVHSVI